MSRLSDAPALLALLDQWVTQGWLRALDHSLARLLHEQCEQLGEPAPPALLLLAALTSHQVGRGHVCLDLNALRDHPEALLSLPPEALEDDTRVTPGQLIAKIDDWSATLSHAPLLSHRNSPLVLAGERLYLRRYWRYEQIIADGIQTRLARQHPMADPTSPESGALAQVLTQLFGPPSETTDWQKVACALAARAAFSVITGGPGTGKTTTVLKLLAALQAVALSGERGQELQIRLAAPTGKAAARLNESIRSKVSVLDLGQLPEAETLRESIPTQVVTLHRLLGSRPDTRRLRHHEDNPLAVDVLVVDEASMVDVELMAGLIRALPAHARLILLGDKDQLASVDAGAVLGDLCQRADAAHYRPATLEWLHTVAGEQLDSEYRDDQGGTLDQSITMLRRSYRFGRHSGIGYLARAVRQGDAEALAAQASAWQDYEDVHRLTSDDALMDLALEGLRGYLTAIQQAPSDPTPDQQQAWAQDILDRQSQFQVLAALRQGRNGVEGLNERIAARLQRAGLIDASNDWYPGRPVLVTRNDYALNLMNGDIGITLPIRGANGEPSLRVVFPTHDGSGTLKWVLPSRLQSVETVYAMTVHKSQGSEFRHTCLVLPEHPSAVLTRELIYTGITRASEQLTLAVPSESALTEGIQRRLHRASGLAALSQ